MCSMINCIIHFNNEDFFYLKKKNRTKIKVAQYFTKTARYQSGEAFMKRVPGEARNQKK